MRKLILTALMGLSLGATSVAYAAGNAPVPPKQDWSFKGFFGGSFDREDLKKGGKIYFEICAGCHSMDMMAYRNLVEIGAWTEEEAKEIAAFYEVMDGPNDEGEMFMRPARLSDRFKAPYPNKKAATAANGAYPPDLSVITKARKGGPDYIYALLTGYKDEVPEELADTFPAGANFNTYFPGHAIAMFQPLYGETVEFADGSSATLEEEARYVTTFLAWAAEPELEDRSQLGIKVLLFLIVLTGMLFVLKKRIWARIHDAKYTHGPYEKEFQESIDAHKLDS